jgi:chorismate dehydratase
MFTLGVVSYLNALPLYRTLETEGAVEVIRELPARLTPRLAAGECDAALIPIVDSFRGNGSGVISDACIGSTGAVRSVLMFSKCEPGQVRSVAADTSSHTSVAMLRIILSDGYACEPPFVDRSPDVRAMLEEHDAALVIGDNALEAALSLPKTVQVLDLGQAWRELTGTSFVYAAWVARRGLTGAPRQELADLLSAARDEGLKRLPAVVRANPNPTRLTPSAIEDYLTNAIEFYRTDKHRAGMEEFERRCRQHGLVGLSIRP